MVGAGYVAGTFALGRRLFGSDRDGLLLAGIAAVFPLFALSYGIKARTYGVLLLLGVICLLLGVRVGWSTRPPTWWAWAGFGLIAGLSVWHDVLLVIPLAALALGFLLRGQVIGWPVLFRGTAIAIAAALVGFSPWLIYNAQTRLGSLRHLYTPLTTYSVPTSQAAKQVLSAALPIFVGARVNFCGPSAVPSSVVDIGLGLLAVAVVWLRRDSLGPVFRGQFSRLEAADVVLLIAPLSLIAVTVHWFNGLSCEPRYLMPLAIPLVLALALTIRASLPFRIAGLLALAGCLVMSFATVQTSHTLFNNLVQVPGAPPARLDLPAAVVALQRQSPQAIWAQYWLARPVEYLSGDRLLVGEYGGYVGFPDTQSAALAAAHPGWLFVEGDPTIAAFRAACSSRGITYRQTAPGAGLVFFADLSQRLTPSDLGLQTQTVAQAA